MIKFNKCSIGLHDWEEIDHKLTDNQLNIYYYNYKTNYAASVSHDSICLNCRKIDRRFTNQIIALVNKREKETKISEDRKLRAEHLLILEEANIK